MPTPTRRSPAKSRIDQYIKNAPSFAQPICRRLREIILAADLAMVEDWKWGPNYSKNGMVCGFGAFKQHVSLAFFQGASMKDPGALFVKEPVAAKSMRRVKFTAVGEINGTMLTRYIREAVALNEKGVKAPVRTIAVSNDLTLVLGKSKGVKQYFDSLSYTHKKEYVRWIETAKKEETRKARLKKAFELLSKMVKRP